MYICYIMGIFLSVPIAIIYNLFVSKISEMLTKDDQMKEKVQKNLMIQIVGGIVALVLAFMVFGKNKFKNLIVKYGLILGGGILLIYSLVCNWDVIADHTKLIAIGGALILLILYSYKSINSKNEEEDDEDLEKIKN
jgi:branched-subunit amino acid transport protein AzlD